MSHVLIWDLPTRFFHWLLAIGFAIAAVIALACGEHSPLFPYHSMIGLALGLMVVLRVLWGFIGSRYARWNSFLFGPTAVVDYLKQAASGGGRRYVGHNPGSAYVILAMLILMLGLTATGILLGRGTAGIKESHEFLAYAMLAAVTIHIVGVFLHTIRHRENITASMIHGRKVAPPTDGIETAHRFAALVLLIVSSAWFLGLWRNFDPATQATRVPILGTALQLGEEEEQEESGERGEATGRHEDE